MLSGKECQLAAWQDGHKTECTALATARLEQLVSGLEGEEGFDRFLVHFVDMAYEGKAFAPLELQWLRSVKQLCRTLLSKADRVLQWYLYSLMAEAAVAGGGMAMTIPERAKAEAAVKDLVSALTQHRVALLQTSPSRFILAINMAVQLLGALGRHSEGVALGRRELPGIEGLYAKGERKLRRHVALYVLQLTDWVLEAADEQWAQHCARMRQGDKDDDKTPEEQTAIAEEKHAELKAEAEGLALRALSFADDVHMGGEEVRRDLPILPEGSGRKGRVTQNLPLPETPRTVYLADGCAVASCCAAVPLRVCGGRPADGSECVG